MPVSVPARRPRSSTAATVAHRRAPGTQAFLGPGDERPRAPAARRRATFMWRDAICLHFPAPTPRPPALGKPRWASPTAPFRGEGVITWFVADCRVSTVLEKFRVATTAKPLTLASRRLWASGGGCSLGTANSKFEIRTTWSPYAESCRTVTRRSRSDRSADRNRPRPALS